jgi:hypothetical protein
MALMFLNGEGMQGGGAHGHISGSAFLGEIRTAPHYRFLAFGTEFPGLLPVDQGGTRVLGELYDVPMDKLRRLLGSEPDQLELSVVALAEGRLSFGMVVRAGRADDPEVVDITAVASWRQHLSRLA